MCVCVCSVCSVCSVRVCVCIDVVCVYMESVCKSSNMTAHETFIDNMYVVKNFGGKNFDEMVLLKDWQKIFGESKACLQILVHAL